ncbi:unnamed protein product [Haemonchus placei]|uniref:Uncharacterized protein n=1 Tax=Haemonchus placei TaxID=6290 RepID=A0A0N4WFE8_HAEPC|nr:unnamed protein product [Haemonchus placei]
MARTFYNDERNLLSTDPDRVKMKAKELMATLDSHRAHLSDLRESLQLEQLEEQISFHDEVRNTLQNIQETVDKFANQPGRSAAAQQRHDQDQPEEPYEEEDEDEELETDEPESDGEDVRNEEAPRAIEMGNEQKEVVPAQRPRHVIEAELHEERRASNQVAMIIEDLMSPRTCPPRRRGGGLPRSVALRNPPIKCAFCHATGSHRADACTHVRTVRERRILVQRQKKCGRCLEQCPGNSMGRMLYAKCFYCKKRRSQFRALRTARSGVGNLHQTGRGAKAGGPPLPTHQRASRRTTAPALIPYHRRRREHRGNTRFSIIFS